MKNIKKWEYVIKSLKKIKATKRGVDLAETLQEQLEVYDLNRNTIAWNCYPCVIYLRNCKVCPINSPSIKECCKELMELIDIVAELDYKRAELTGLL
jgi:hypothetical protein